MKDGPDRNPAPAIGILIAVLLIVVSDTVLPTKAAKEGGTPRIVNIYNFIRNSDYRLRNSEDVLFDCTQRQIKLLKTFNLPATWALQYDALINPRYQKLLKEELGRNDEIAAWWEIPQPLVEKAGLQWRGQHEWDPRADVGFSPGYTPDERRKLVDVYMTEFKAVFGAYPKSAGSWFIDEVTLEYMATKYGIVASCNCKDQVGTDGYTLWGSYWNQAYYPSRLNAYMPAQTRAGQINVPVFRMLGSDPIYQGFARGMWTLEPVYPRAGGSGQWVNWFMNNLIHQPALAFGYTQAGQENSFGWPAMQKGFELQIALLAKQAKAGEIQVQTLAQSGEWFRQHYAVTPSTAVVALDDWRHQGRKSVWYDSRFYRLNLLWEEGVFYVRDLHRFDETVISPTHDTVLKTTALAYGTLPIMDGACWSKPEKAGIWPIILSSNGGKSAMVLSAPPIVKEISKTDLSIVQSLRDGGSLSIVCNEAGIVFLGVDAQGNPVQWALDIAGGVEQKARVQKVTSTGIEYLQDTQNYQLRVARDSGSCQQLENGVIRLTPNSSGNLILRLDTTGQSH